MNKNKLNIDFLLSGIKIIKNYIKPHKKSAFLIIIIGIIGSIANAFTPFLAGKIFDALVKIYNKELINLTYIFVILGLWLVLKIINDLSDWYNSIHLEKIATIIEAEYISDGFKHLISLPIHFHKEKKHGEVIDKITRAGQWIATIISSVSLSVVMQSLTMIFAFILVFMINFKLALILFVSVLIYAFFLIKFAPQLVLYQRQVQKNYSRAYGDTYDKIQNISEIKQNAMENFEATEIYKKFVKYAASSWLKLNQIMQKLNISQNLLVTITQLILFVISIFFIQKNEITIGGLAAFNGYAAMVLGPFVSLGRNWQNIQNGLVSIIRAEKILKTEREIYNPPNAISFKNIRGEIEFKNVSFAYKNSKESVLKNISFKINPGEKIALVGKSGVGKTTLIELILGFYFPQKGEVLIDGVNIKKLNLLNYRKRIAIVPQEPTLFNESIKYNIKYGKESASFSQIKKAAELAYADEFIEKFPKKYNQIVGWRGVKLSIGQKQRIALARAFLKNPDVLILDEPTSALDTKSEYLIKKSLKKLMENKTAIIIAHRLSTIKEVDKIFVIDEGEIKEIGTHSELLNNPNSIYKSFYDLQIKDFLT